MNEDLVEFLSGEKGIAALDMARELVARRVEVEALTLQHTAASNSALHYAEVAEAEMHAHALTKERLNSLCTMLANMSADVREFLGRTPENKEVNT